jgi:hypothetical protein
LSGALQSRTPLLWLSKAKELFTNFFQRDTRRDSVLTGRDGENQNNRTDLKTLVSIDDFDEFLKSEKTL